MATKRISDLPPVDRAKLGVKFAAKSNQAPYDMDIGERAIRRVRSVVGTKASQSAAKDAMNLAPTKSHSKGPTMAQQAAAKDAFNLGKK